MAKIILNRKTYLINELVFRQLRAIGKAYNVLANHASPDPAKAEALHSLIFALIGKPIKLNRISPSEWQALFNALPTLYGVDKDESVKKISASSDNWGRIYAHLSSCFGWDYDYIDNHMTLSRLKEYGDYIKDNPPVHQMVAAFLGVNSRKEDAGDALLSAMLHKAKQLNQQRAAE